MIVYNLYTYLGLIKKENKTAEDWIRIKSFEEIFPEFKEVAEAEVTEK